MAIPRQWPLHNGAQGEDGAASLPEAPVVPQAPGQPHAHHPADEAGNRAAGVTPAAPPAWPPVPKQAESEVVASAEPPYVPPVFSAALDMTAEMPRVRVDWEQDADHTAPAAAGPNGGTGQRFADETMELPIFRELESAWFHKPSSGPIEAASTNGTPATDTESHERASVPSARPERNGIPAAASSPLAAVEASDESAVPAMSSAQFDAETRQPQAPAESPSWQTAADEGWQAASALAEEQDFTTTPTGLPKRVPMSQLVPGGVEKGTVSAHKRTPEAVRGLLSAYHRGVQRGRSNKSGDAKTPEHTTAGPQSSQGGKEQEA
jgi:hypothetical protein